MSLEDFLFVMRLGAAAFAAIAFSGLLLSAGLAMTQRRLSVRRARRTDRPPVSVVIPLKELEEEFVKAQQSAFAQDYCAFDVTFTARESDSQALDLAREIMSAHPSVESRLVRSSATFAVSPKINNLAQAVATARHDVIFMKDSNIILQPGAIAAAVSCLGPDVGLVVAVPQAQGAKSFPAAIEASIMNQSHGRLLAAAAALGLGFGVGKLMVFRRSDLSRVGGFEAKGLADSVGEDSALSHALARIGLRTTFMAPPILQSLGYRPFKSMFDRQMRWTAIRRRNEIVAFLIEPFGLSLCASLAAGLAAPLFGLSASWTALGALFLWYGVETALAFARGWAVSRDSFLVMAARDAMMLAIWCAAWTRRKVVWAAQTYEVKRDNGFNETPDAPRPAEGSDQ